MTTRLGGSTFSPGEEWAVSYTPSPAFPTTATVKLRIQNTEVTGTLLAGVCTFSFTCAQTAALAENWIYDAQVSADDCDRIDVVEFETGTAKIGTAATNPEGYTSVTRLDQGSGIKLTPNPITSQGTIQADIASTDLEDFNGVAAAAGGQVLTWNASTNKWDPGTFNLSNVANVGTGAPSDGDSLTYNSTSSDWEPATPKDLAPATGSAVTIVGKAYSPAQDAQAPVKRQTFYHAASSVGTGGGAATLIASGVEFVLSCRGWWETQSSGARELIEQKWIEFDGDEVSYNRSSHPAAGPDGYYLVLDYVETT